MRPKIAAQELNSPSARIPDVSTTRNASVQDPDIVSSEPPDVNRGVTALNGGREHYRRNLSSFREPIGRRCCTVPEARKSNPVDREVGPDGTGQASRFPE